MSTLRLVNKQPMETLPVAGDRGCFIEYNDVSVHMIWRRDLIEELREYEAVKRGERTMMSPTAWSYTATFEPEITNKESKNEHPTTCKRSTD